MNSETGDVQKMDAIPFAKIMLKRDHVSAEEARVDYRASPLPLELSRLHKLNSNANCSSVFGIAFTLCIWDPKHLWLACRSASTACRSAPTVGFRFSANGNRCTNLASAVSMDSSHATAPTKSSAGS